MRNIPVLYYASTDAELTLDLDGQVMYSVKWVSARDAPIPKNLRVATTYRERAYCDLDTVHTGH